MAAPVTGLLALVVPVLAEEQRAPRADSLGVGVGTHYGTVGLAYTHRFLGDRGAAHPSVAVGAGALGGALEFRYHRAAASPRALPVFVGVGYTLAGPWDDLSVAHHAAIGTLGLDWHRAWVGGFLALAAGYDLESGLGWGGSAGLQVNWGADTNPAPRPLRNTRSLKPRAAPPATAARVEPPDTPGLPSVVRPRDARDNVERTTTAPPPEPSTGRSPLGGILRTTQVGTGADEGAALADARLRLVQRILGSLCSADALVENSAALEDLIYARPEVFTPDYDVVDAVAGADGVRLTVQFSVDIDVIRGALARARVPMAPR